jgi:hypothetical protein
MGPATLPKAPASIHPHSTPYAHPHHLTSSPTPTPNPPNPQPPTPDWGDAHCIEILKAIRANVSGPAPCHAGGKGVGSRALWADVTLLIVETTFSETVLPCLARHRATSDMIMMMSFGSGAERSEEQFSELLRAAGWRLGRVTPANGLLCVVEALPA